MSTRYIVSKLAAESEASLIEVEKENLGHCRVRLTVKVAPLLVQQEYQEAIKQINKEVSIPGFRKGKVPPSLIDKHFHSHVKNRHLDCIANEAYRRAVRQTQCYPTSRDQIQTKCEMNPDAEKGAVFSYEFEMAPRVPIVNPSELLIDYFDEIPITKEVIDLFFDRWLEQEGKWEKGSEDHGIEEGNLVHIDVDEVGLEGDKRIFESISFVFHADDFEPWFSAALAGQKVGQEVLCTSTKPEASSSSDEASEAAEEESLAPAVYKQYRIHIREIALGSKAVVDDALLQRSRASNVEGVRTNIKSALEARVEDLCHRHYVHQVKRLLADKYSFEIPESYVQSAVAGILDEMWSDMLQRPKHERMSREELASKVWEEVSADKRVDLLLLALARENHIQVSKEHLAEKLNMELMKSKIGLESLWNDQIPREQLYHHFEYQFLTQAALQYCIEHASKQHKGPVSCEFIFVRFCSLFKRAKGLDTV